MKTIDTYYPNGNKEDRVDTFIVAGKAFHVAGWGGRCFIFVGMTDYRAWEEDRAVSTHTVAVELDSREKCLDYLNQKQEDYDKLIKVTCI